jgi:uncharacterized membrane protein YgdD (TMEM256/DUF423 family)
MNNKITQYVPKTITKQQATDTGMAMVLICLIVGVVSKKQQPFVLAIPLLLINMTYPLLYKPAAIIWLGFSTFLGTIVSKILLSVLFVCLVTPIGLFRRIIGADPLQIKKWKKDSASVFSTRNHTFSSDDVKMPY